MNSPGLFSNIPNSFCSAGYNMFFTNELLPQPDTPVIVVITPKGIFTFIFFKLFSRAPIIFIKSLLFLLNFGTEISIFLFKLESHLNGYYFFTIY